MKQKRKEGERPEARQEPPDAQAASVADDRDHFISTLRKISDRLNDGQNEQTGRTCTVELLADLLQRYGQQMHEEPEWVIMFGRVPQMGQHIMTAAHLLKEFCTESDAFCRELDDLHLDVHQLAVG
jgi:hypothetical protein